MKRLNKKGFSLVELLATIVILGVLSATTIIAYSRYKEKARIQAYDTLADSAMHAMENYLMANPETTSAVTINNLYYNQYLERPADASSPENECVGNVQATSVAAASGDKKLDTYNYTVTICCSNYKTQYQFNHGSDKPTKTTVSDNMCTSIKNTTDAEKAAEAEDGE